MFNDLIIYQFKKSLNAIAQSSLKSHSDSSSFLYNLTLSYIDFLNRHIFIDFCFKRFQIVFGNLKILIIKELEKILTKGSWIETKNSI